MSRQKKPPSNSAYTSAPLSGGKKKESSKQSKRLQDKEGTTFNPIRDYLDLFALPSSTPESLVAPNRATLTDKLPPSPIFTQMPKSSQKLAADSILNAKNFLPYWKESCKELSDVLLSPIKTDLLDSGLTCSNGSVNKTGAKSWFSMKQVFLQKPKWLRTCDVRSCG